MSSAVVFPQPSLRHMSYLDVFCNQSVDSWLSGPNYLFLRLMNIGAYNNDCQHSLGQSSGTFRGVSLINQFCFVFLILGIVPYKDCEIVLYKGSKVPGLILVGGADTILKGVFIKKVLPDFPAAKDGRLQPGDQILKINNSSMDGATHNDALHALQQSSAYIHLTVRREPSRKQPPIVEEGM